MSTQARHKTVAVEVGGVMVGGGAPIVVQSMTNTDTADAEGTARQVAALARAGSELVRITVDRPEAADAVPRIKERLAQMNVKVPIVGDFHYNGHTLLTDFPACAEALDKYRINPGNVGFKNKRDPQFTQIVEMAIRHNKPVRIGVNWGSLDQELLTKLMDENSASATPVTSREVTHEAMVQSAILSAQRAEEIGLPKNRIILSAKVSAVSFVTPLPPGWHAARLRPIAVAAKGATPRYFRFEIVMPWPPRCGMNSCFPNPRGATVRRTRRYHHFAASVARRA